MSAEADDPSSVNHSQVFFVLSTAGFQYTFYREMHYSPKRVIVIVSCLSVCLSVTLLICDHTDDE